jgi:steroid 5-alpha reductase family enzyme
MISSILLFASAIYFGYMTLLWLIGLRVRNFGLVDFGWPSGFTALALLYAFTGDGIWQRKALIVAMYCICGARFMLGWTVRNVRDGEDRRWNYWRERWQNGEGMFAIRSIPVNLFAFYHAQTFATLLVFAAPLALACNSASARIQPLEWIAVVVWGVSFLLENVADFQLDRFRKNTSGKSGVCRAGLWKYSRHPNYFFEFLIWVSYAVYALPSAGGPVDYLLLILVPITAYWFLVHFTGIPITESASLQRRGETYARYQTETNRFFPWFPRKTIK